MIGKLQSNKIKFAVKLFDFIHSVDNEKLAKKIAEEQLKDKKKGNLYSKLMLEMKVKNQELIQIILVIF